MIKGKIYKCNDIVVFCTSTNIEENALCFEGFVIKSDIYSSLGYHSIAWLKNDFEEYIGQLDLNNVLINNHL